MKQMLRLLGRVPGYILIAGVYVLAVPYALALQWILRLERTPAPEASRPARARLPRPEERAESRSISRARPAPRLAAFQGEHSSR